MIYLDIKYLNMISFQLEGMKQKKDNVYEMRCRYCGDSKKNSSKKRGFIFPFKNDLRYYCHNCGKSIKFAYFLKDVNQILYQEYVLEKFKDSRQNIHQHTAEPDIPSVDMSRFISDELLEEESHEDCTECTLLKKFKEICVPCSSLPPDNQAVKYLHSRKIPKYAHNILYYIDDTTKLKSFDPDIKIPFGEPRLVIPFIDMDGRLLGFTCRSLKSKTKLRYLTVRLTKDNTEALIFGLDRVDPSKKIYVFEGGIDSLFIPNAIAVTGTAFGKVDDILDKLGISRDNVVLVVDNQPRNKEVCDVLEKFIRKGYTCCVWDISDEIGKDVNALITDGGMSPKDVFAAIKRCSYKGLAAMAKYGNWRKC